MICRSVPSYSPTARARVTADCCPEQPRQSPLARGNGSPHLSQIGGVMGRIDCQQPRHTHPDSGSSRRASQAAHAGASKATPSAFVQAEIRNSGLAIGHRAVISDRGCGIRLGTGVHSLCALMRTSSESTSPCSIFPMGSIRTIPFSAANQARVSGVESIRAASPRQPVSRVSKTDDSGTLSLVADCLLRCWKEWKCRPESVGWRT